MKCTQCNCDMSQSEIQRHIEDDETMDRCSPPECDECAGLLEDNHDDSLDYEMYSDADNGL